jgi:hypothetical protein
MLVSEVAAYQAALNPLQQLFDKEIEAVQSTVVSVGKSLRNWIGAEAFQTDSLEQSSNHFTSPGASLIANMLSQPIIDLTDRFDKQVSRLEVEINKLTERKMMSKRSSLQIWDLGQMTMLLLLGSESLERNICHYQIRE